MSYLQSDTVKSADDTEVAIWVCPLFFVGSDLRLLYKYGNTETGLLSKHRSDPTDNHGLLLQCRRPILLCRCAGCQNANLKKGF